MSMKFTPIACVRTSSWLRPAMGSGFATYRSTSGPPSSVTLIARMLQFYTSA
jgi:hypothetical protein